MVDLEAGKEVALRLPCLSIHRKLPSFRKGGVPIAWWRIWEPQKYILEGYW